MTKPRSKKARKSSRDQDVSGRSAAMVVQPQALTNHQSSYALVQDQNRMEYLLYQMEQQQLHLFVLQQQQKDSAFMYSLSSRHHAEFLRALSLQQQYGGGGDYLSALARHQRDEYDSFITQQRHFRQHLHVSGFAQQQQFAQRIGIGTLGYGGQASQQPQVATTTATTLPTTGNASMDPLEILGEDIHRHILSFLMCLREGRASPAVSAVDLYIRANQIAYKATHPNLPHWKVREGLVEDFQGLSSTQKTKWDKLADQDQKRYAKEKASFTTSRQLAEICRGLSLVSKPWRLVTGDYMNSNAPSDILSPSDLFVLKHRVRLIQLSSISTNFIKLVKEKWGEETFEDDDLEDVGFPTLEGRPLLDLVIQEFGGTYKGFAKLVAWEYRQFLLVKAVETIASCKYGKNRQQQGSSTVLAWKEKCQPTQLVDLFWHAHMQAPQQYAIDCHCLIGDMVSSSNAGDFAIDSIIDHDAGYVSSNKYKESDYASKRDAVFAFEKQFSVLNVFGGRRHFGLIDASVLCDEEFNVRHIAAEILSNMQECNDCG